MKKKKPKLTELEIGEQRKELQGILYILYDVRAAAEIAINKVIKPLEIGLRKLQDGCPHPNLERYPGGESCAICGLDYRY